MRVLFVLLKFNIFYSLRSEAFLVIVFVILDLFYEMKFLVHAKKSLGSKLKTEKAYSHAHKTIKIIMASIGVLMSLKK